MTDFSQLSDEELIRRIRSGEQLPEDYLLEKYKPLVRKCSRALFLAGGDQEDLLQEGMLGLFRAIREYRFDRDSLFKTFAEICISRQMYTAVLAAGRQKNVILNQSVPLDDMDPAHQELALGRAESPETIIIRQEDVRWQIEELKKKLSPLENRVIDCYLAGFDRNEIAERLGKSYKSVDNALQRIRMKAENH